MGNGLSEEERIDKSVRELGDGPDVKVNQRIVDFCSLDSSDMLRRHYERRMEASDCAPDWIKNLAEKLGAFTSAPELAGLGALAIAIFIDIVSFSPAEESMKDALRCVFAEEKASEVWDQIDECLKRCRMNFTNRHELSSDLKQIEGKLSAALTKLKNSMLRDGHMTNEALKAWVNGAAFHIQMLIHLVRLGGTVTCNTVETLISDYQNDLIQLFKEHKEMIRKKCKMSFTVETVTPFRNTVLVDENSKGHTLDFFSNPDKFLEAYYDHRYGGQKHEIQQHFSSVRENLQSLVSQRGSFNF
ncbi:uncharacterized protein LOC121884506 isoform X2 [Thunnus maccoyii]|nr:uncharacterized protein LOC121884506 isoform X2 [Thunnus maccoyii]XP_042249293.1 uncharacterized protein LOC121884506 isoform X2 [Thunnus maccoyii]XP_042249294.1 uncharacterized protein LOC121884506 isoform X2 [Thunnus maccoyii]